MSKLTREDKIEIYERNKNGETIASLAKAFNVNKIVLHYLIRLIRKHGYDIIGNGENKHYSKEFKLQLLPVFYIIGFQNLKKTGIML